MRLVLFAILALAAFSGCNSRTTDIRCGGLINFACPADMYCQQKENCGGLDQEGVCKPRPIQCKGEVAPVCGCDGQEYSSLCLAEAKGVSVRNPGRCAEQSTTADSASTPEPVQE